MTLETIQSLKEQRNAKMLEAKQLNASMTQYIADYERLFGSIQVDINSLTEAIGETVEE